MCTKIHQSSEVAKKVSSISNQIHETINDYDENQDQEESGVIGTSSSSSNNIRKQVYGNSKRQSKLTVNDTSHAPKDSSPNNETETQIHQISYCEINERGDVTKINKKFQQRNVR